MRCSFDSLTDVGLLLLMSAQTPGTDELHGIEMPCVNPTQPEQSPASSGANASPPLACTIVKADFDGSAVSDGSSKLSEVQSPVLVQVKSSGSCCYTPRLIAKACCAACSQNGGGSCAESRQLLKQGVKAYKEWAKTKLGFVVHLLVWIIKAYLVLYIGTSGDKSLLQLSSGVEIYLSLLKQPPMTHMDIEKCDVDSQLRYPHIYGLGQVHQSVPEVTTPARYCDGKYILEPREDSTCADATVTLSTRCASGAACSNRKGVIAGPFLILEDAGGLYGQHACVHRGGPSKDQLRSYNASGTSCKPCNGITDERCWPEHLPCPFNLAEMQSTFNARLLSDENQTVVPVGGSQLVLRRNGTGPALVGLYMTRGHVCSGKVSNTQSVGSEFDVLRAGEPSKPAWYDVINLVSAFSFVGCGPIDKRYQALYSAPLSVIVYGGWKEWDQEFHITGSYEYDLYGKVSCTVDATGERCPVERSNAFLDWDNIYSPLVLVAKHENEWHQDCPYTPAEFDAEVLPLALLSQSALISALGSFFSIVYLCFTLALGLCGLARIPWCRRIEYCRIPTKLLMNLLALGQLGIMVYGLHTMSTTTTVLESAKDCGDDHLHTLLSSFSSAATAYRPTVFELIALHMVQLLLSFTILVI